MRFEIGRPATDIEAVAIFPLLIEAWVDCLNLLLEGLERVDELSIVHVIVGGESEVAGLLDWADKVRPYAND